MVHAQPSVTEVLRPYMIADDFLSTVPPAPRRFVIDFGARSILEAKRFGPVFDRIERLVLPDRREKAAEEEERNKEALAENPKARVNGHHKNFLKRWWLHSYGRAALLEKVRELPRYVACGCVTKRPVFVFVSSAINPNAALQVFGFADDYSFGVLQSDTHWRWFVERCSTLKGDFRYTSNTVYDSFPWPQSPTIEQVRSVAKAGAQLRALRDLLMAEHGYSLRELYRTLELPGDNPLKHAHSTLDSAVRKAYGMGARASVLEFIFALNQEVSEREQLMQHVTGPGLPPSAKDPQEFLSNDCIPPPMSTS